MGTDFLYNTAAISRRTHTQAPPRTPRKLSQVIASTTPSSDEVPHLPSVSGTPRFSIPSVDLVASKPPSALRRRRRQSSIASSKSSRSRQTLFASVGTPKNFTGKTLESLASTSTPRTPRPPHVKEERKAPLTCRSPKRGDHTTASARAAHVKIVQLTSNRPKPTLPTHSATSPTTLARPWALEEPPKMAPTPKPEPTPQAAMEEQQQLSKRRPSLTHGTPTLTNPLLVARTPVASPPVKSPVKRRVSMSKEINDSVISTLSISAGSYEPLLPLYGVIMRSPTKGHVTERRRRDTFQLGSAFQSTRVSPTESAPLCRAPNTTKEVFPDFPHFPHFPNAEVSEAPEVFFSATAPPLRSRRPVPLDSAPSLACWPPSAPSPRRRSSVRIAADDGAVLRAQPRRRRWPSDGSWRTDAGDSTPRLASSRSRAEESGAPVDFLADAKGAGRRGPWHAFARPVSEAESPCRRRCNPAAFHSVVSSGPSASALLRGDRGESAGAGKAPDGAHSSHRFSASTRWRKVGEGRQASREDTASPSQPRRQKREEERGGNEEAQPFLPLVWLGLTPGREEERAGSDVMSNAALEDSCLS